MSGRHSRHAFDFLWREMVHAARRLARTPLFTMTALATLTVGIGAAAGLFVFASATLLRPLPYASPAELVRLFETDPRRDWSRNPVAPANLHDWRQQNTVFSEIAAYDGSDDKDQSRLDVFLTGVSEPQRLKAISVSANLFRVLGVKPMVGRGFLDEEDFDAGRRAVILSHALWEALFARDSEALGRTLELNGRTHQIVGIMPAGFAFPGRDVQLWLPFNYQKRVFLEARYFRWLNVVARLRAGVSLERAQEDMTRISTGLAKAYPETNATAGVHLEPLHESFARDWRRPLQILLAAAALLFGVICLNLAGLQIARGAGRTREMTIRRALGANRGQLLWHATMEAALLAAAGGALGVWIASLVRAGALRHASAIVPVFTDPRVDGTVLALCLGLSCAAMVLCGLLPALVTTRPAVLADRSNSGARPWLQQLLIGGQIAIAVMLVVAAGLLTRTLLNLERVDPGFAADSALTFTVAFPGSRYPAPDNVLRAVEGIEAALRSLPLVERVGATSTLPLGRSQTRGGARSSEAVIEGRSPADYERGLLHESITPDYFQAVGGRLIRGRFLDARDSAAQPLVVLVNETLAARYYRDASPLGRRMSFETPSAPPRWVTIVGVVADEKQGNLDQPVRPKAYTPLAQHVEPRLSFIVRSRLEPGAALTEARRVVQRIDRGLVLTDATTLSGLVDADLAERRLRTHLMTGFSAVALLLIAMGLYGTLSLFVTQHAREMAVRLALGASRRQLVANVVTHGMRPVVLGLLGGLAGAYAEAGLVEAHLFGFDGRDWRTFAAAALIVSGTTIAATLIPAWRTTRQDPLVVLRTD